MQEGTWNVDCRVGSPCADGRGVFLLRRMGPCVGSCRVQVDFATPAAVDASAPSCLSNLPTYNLDHQPFTPSFMLPTDQARLTHTSQQYLVQHQRKLEQLINEKHEMFVPQPSKANRFCCICKQHYQDYLTHVTTPSHQRLLRQSTFTTHIEELCSTVSVPTHQTSQFNEVKEVNKRAGKKHKKITKQRKIKAYSESSTSGSFQSLLLPTKSA